MASDAALYARLEVKLATLEKQLKKAGLLAEEAVLDIEKKFAKANPKLGGATAFGTFIGDLAGKATQVAIRAVQELAQAMRELGATADLTGLSLKEIYSIQQAIGGQAGQVNAALGSITSLLDQAQRGKKNALSEIFRVNQVDLASIKDAGQAMTQLADIMSRLTAVQAQDLGKALGMTPEVVSNIRAVGAAFEQTAADAAAAAPDLALMAKQAKEFDEAWTRAVGKITALIASGAESAKDAWLAVLGVVAAVLEAIPGAADAAAAVRAKIAANEPGGEVVPPYDPRGAAAPLTAAGGGGARRGGGDRTDDVERYLQQLTKGNDLLRAEASALGLSNVEKAKAVALAKLHAEAREAGRAATDIEIAKTLKLAEVNEALRTEIERTEEAYRAVNTEAKAFASTLVDGLIAGKDAADALGEALNNLGRRLTDRAIDQLFNVLLPSTGGGMFNMLPKFQSGGMVPGSGPVPIMAHGGEMVIPKATVKAMSSGGAGNTYAPVYQIDARNAEAGVEQKIITLIKAYDREAAERRMRFG